MEQNNLLRPFWFLAGAIGVRYLKLAIDSHTFQPKIIAFNGICLLG